MKKEYSKPELEIYELKEDIMAGGASISVEDDPFGDADGGDVSGNNL